MRGPFGCREEFVVVASALALAGLGGKNQHAKLAAAEAVERANALADLLRIKTTAELDAEDLARRKESDPPPPRKEEPPTAARRPPANPSKAAPPPLRLDTD